MLSENSPTLQSMINSVKQTGATQQPQFQTPFPSPKDMVMQGAFFPTPQPTMMPGPVQTINFVNGVPTMFGYDPNVVTRMVDIPGAPINPDLANEPKIQPGRVFPNPITQGQSLYTQALAANMQTQPNLVGSYNPYYGTNSIGWGPQTPFNMPMPQETYGKVDYYDGQPIHPHSNGAWYGSPNYPFYQTSQHTGPAYHDIMRQKFMQAFPGYANPYMGMGFSQPLQPTISPEIQDMANVAAFYGMSYEKFIENSSKSYKMMSRIANRFLGRSEEEIEKRSKTYDVNVKHTSPEPDDDNQLYYPIGAFDPTGKLSIYYLNQFCINKPFKNIKNKMKTSITVDGDTKQHNRKREINPISTAELIERTKYAEQYKQMWLAKAQYLMIQQFAEAPERKVDSSNKSVFEILSDTMAVAEQAELDRKLYIQKCTRSTFLFNHDTFLNDIKGVFERNRKRREDIKIQTAKEAEERRAKEARENMDPKEREKLDKINEYNLTMRERSADVFGDILLAKPGYDISGLPLEQSRTKIIMFNTRTGEEEIYDPAKMSGFEVRERIANAVRPSFNDITKDEELQKRLATFTAIEYTDF